MSFVLRGGRPQTFRYTIDGTGGEYALGGCSAELIFRPQSGSGQLFWTSDDYAAGTNFVGLNSDSYSGEFRLRAAVDRVWITGPLELEITIVAQA